MDHIRVRRVRVRVYDENLAVDALRGFGYRAESRDGWMGPMRKLRQDAVEDMRERKTDVQCAAREDASVAAAARDRRDARSILLDHITEYGAGSPYGR